MSARVCVVTGGHLATCPRMVKAADALAEAGYKVRVISTRHTAWATAADEKLRARRSWSWTPVSFEARGRNRIASGLRQRAALFVARQIGAERCPFPVAARALGRFHSEVLRAAIAEPADFFYGGSGATLAAVAEAARRFGVGYALDLEDFHPGEQQEDAPDGELNNALAARIEQRVLPGAAFVTVGSAAIGAAYSTSYGIAPIVVDNAFPLPEAPPDLDGGGARLKLYWFSQTIGPRRGIEDAVRAIGAAAVDAELHLRGNSRGDYVESLQRLAASIAPRMRLERHAPIAPDEMVASCRGFDVGLALEPGVPRNNALALSNKALTYPLAGLAVAMTDTPGQRPLAGELGDGALLVPPGDVAALAAGLRRWAEDRALLTRAKQAAWEAARRRWHWEHERERGALLDAARRALS
jgi:hypothetical protein